MKKIAYTLFAFMIALTSCDPLEDVYEDLDANLPPAGKDLAITLTNPNYQSLRGKPGVPTYVNTAFYFATEEEAAALIPMYLNDAYPHLADKSSIMVTFNLLGFDYTNNTVATTTATGTAPATPLPIYTLTSDDYTNIGITNNRLDVSNNDLHAIRFLDYKFPTPVNNQLVVFTFNGYNSRVSSTAEVMTDSFYYKNGAWRNAYHVSMEDYASVNRGRFNNFEAIDTEALPMYFDRFLKKAVINPKVGEVQFVSYNFFSGGSSQRILTMVYNGTNWVELKQDVLVPATLMFTKKDGQWLPDLTIKIQLATADYEAIAANPNIGTPENRENLNRFKNFFQAGSTSDTRYWTDAQIKAGIAALLKTKFPNAEVGQKYQVSYIVYRGSNVTVSTTFIKNAAGNFVEFVG